MDANDNRPEFEAQDDVMMMMMRIYVLKNCPIGTYITKMMTQNSNESKNRYVLCSISNKYGAVWDWPLHRNGDDYQSAG